ncbi:MAG TPA: HipA family kinase [Vicinamibacterales bacterium]|nr:HipA family kinase [Vicinamibacterales bacterium]
MRSIRTVRVTRYVTPLREGGSLPAIVDADDDGLYVLKFRGAGQGARALVAELISGEIARSLGLPVPEIVFAELDRDLARTEPDPEIHQLIYDSDGLNLALDYLPGSVSYDPAVHRIASELASRIVWFDSLVSNVDRTVRNTNMLMWHRQPWLIDHGATLYFHHLPGWESDGARSRAPFPMIRDHVLLRAASAIATVDEALANALTPETIDGILALVPDAWLADETATPAAAHRQAYARYLRARLEAPRVFVAENLDAR